MSSGTRKIVKSGKNDKRFLDLAKKYVSGFPVPNYWSDKKEEALFALFYIGYLLGKHEDDPEKHLTEE